MRKPAAGLRPRLFTAILPALILALAWLSPARGAQSDEDCLTCHSDPELKRAEGASLSVSQEKYARSSHGQAGLACLDCHADLRGIRDFPHAERLKRVSCASCHEKPAADMALGIHGRTSMENKGLLPGCPDCHGRHDIGPGSDFESPTAAINLPRTCGRCHLERVKNGRGGEFIRQYENSIHFRAIKKSGLTLSASCSSCHGTHAIQRADTPPSLVSRKNIIRTCGQCHVGIEKDYLDGVHGKDYVKGIKDVPVCTDCHSEHSILPARDPNSRIYTTHVAEVCARCHDNLTIARQYRMSASRLKSFSDSYHGTALKFGETRVANCSSCHGFHDIRAASDPKSSINPDNLPQTCGRCHAGAGKNFARGKIHAIQDETVAAKYRSSHVIKRIYLVLIAVILSSLVLFIAADLFRRAVSGKRHG
jgi:hypothetical protein